MLRQNTPTKEVPGFDWYSRKAFLLPTDVLYKITREEELEEERQAEERTRKRAEAAALKKQEEALATGASQEPDPYKFPTPPLRKPYLKIFNKSDVFAYFGKVDTLTSDRDERKQIGAQLEYLRKRGEYRELATIPQAWRNGLDRLEEDHENFAPVIKYLRGVCAIAELGDGVARPGNIVLDGPPGCGKTYFTKKLAQFMQTDYHAVHLETMQSSGELLGEAEFYKSAKPGKLFNFLIDGRYANPLILMDEICKIGGDPRFDPRTALFRLFERETAKTYTDTYNNWLELDYSRAWFVCTSNDYERIDGALRSRLKRFTIEMPKDASKIIQNVLASVKSELPKACCDMTLTKGALEALKRESPRRIRQLIESAIGMALIDRRKEIIAQDIDVEKARPPIGFS